MTDKKRILKIATNVRLWGEENNKSGLDEGLSGLCGICSYEIFMRLRKAKLAPQIVFTTGHVWVFCKGFVVDVTATQFDDSLPCVVVEKYQSIPCKHNCILKNNQGRAYWKTKQSTRHRDKWYWTKQLVLKRHDKIVEKFNEWPSLAKPVSLREHDTGGNLC